MNAFLVMNVIVMAVITDNLGTKNFIAQNCETGWSMEKWEGGSQMGGC